MSDVELTPDSVILGEQAYVEALDLVIASATSQLSIFDQNLALGDYASIKRYDALHTFLNKSSTSQLTVVLHETDYLATQCPRLINLLKTFGHKMTVYETNQHAKLAKDCFILADQKIYIRRVHIDHARFKFSLDDVETTSSLSNRFDELLQETSHQVSTNQLGL